jgi:hypothetical protein
VVIAVFGINFSFDTSKIESNILFHATLADPDLYTNGVYIDKFTINKGEYFFRFVPNGSSPEVLSIILDGESFDFSENFKLEGTSHKTGISEYFTWDYNGQKIISISNTQEISIIINPNGNIMGSVTVDILEN